MRSDTEGEDLLDETSDAWTSVERAIWPEGPAHGHGSGAYAGLKGRIIAALRAESVAAPPLDEAVHARSGSLTYDENARQLIWTDRVGPHEYGASALVAEHVPPWVGRMIEAAALAAPPPAPSHGPIQRTDHETCDPAECGIAWLLQRSDAASPPSLDAALRDDLIDELSTQVGSAKLTAKRGEPIEVTIPLARAERLLARFRAALRAESVAAPEADSTEARLREALMKFGDHKSGCRLDDFTDCTCGWSEFFLRTLAPERAHAIASAALAASPPALDAARLAEAFDRAVLSGSLDEETAGCVKRVRDAVLRAATDGGAVPLMTLFFGPEEIRRSLRSLGSAASLDEGIVKTAAEAAIHVIEGGRLAVSARSGEGRG